MIKILVNDGMHAEGQAKLEAAGFQVDTNKIAQEDLMTKLNDYDAIVVRSATKIRKELIDNTPNLKAIVRGGVGMDNIDVEYARSKGIKVMNTPLASSSSVAELAFAHIFSISRFLFDANRNMPAKGDAEFKSLKKAYSKGDVLRGKTLGLLGFGNIGQETAKIALALGMNVIPYNRTKKTVDINLDLYGDLGSLKVNLDTVDLDEMLAKSDYISLHVPFTGAPAIGEAEFAKMKDGVVLINCARGGTVDEDAMLAALDSGKVAAAGVDVFVNEPSPRKDILEHAKTSVTPHIGGSTLEAQRNIGLEVADQLIATLK